MIISEILFIFIFCYPLLGQNQRHKCPDNSLVYDTCLDESSCPKGYLCMEGICCPTCSTLQAAVQNGSLAGNRYFAPKCDSYGNYLAEQCDETRGVCWCATEFGKEIPGTRLSLAGNGLRQKPCSIERTNNSHFAAATAPTAGRTFTRVAFTNEQQSSVNPTLSICSTRVDGPASCIQQCITDADCSAATKDKTGWTCCWNGCARKCESNSQVGFSDDRGTFINVVGESSKPGSCPYVPYTALTSLTTTENCTSDGSCPGNQKCCSTVKGQKCLYPENGQFNRRGLDSKPGQCPQHSERRPDATVCSKDKDCPENLKCCLNDGGLICRESLSEPNQPVAPDQLWPAQITSAIFDQACRDPNEEFQNCGSPCPSSCEDQSSVSSKPPWCGSSACVRGCFCRRGFIRRNPDYSSPCVAEDQCPITRTSPDSVVSSVPISVPVLECPATHLHALVAQAITARRIPSCSDSHSCPVGQQCCTMPEPLTFLSQRYCLCPDPNAVWSDCGPICPDSCSSNEHSVGDSCRQGQFAPGCQPGCFCVPGYILAARESTAKCIRRHICTSNRTFYSYNNDSQLLYGNKLANVRLQGTKGHSSINGSVDLEQISPIKTTINGRIHGLKPKSSYYLELHENGNISGDTCESIGNGYEVVRIFPWQTENNYSKTNHSINHEDKVTYTSPSFAANDNGIADFSLMIESQLSSALDAFGDEALIGRSFTLNRTPESFQALNSSEIVACGVIGLVDTRI